MGRHLKVESAPDPFAQTSILCFESLAWNICFFGAAFGTSLRASSARFFCLWAALAFLSLYLLAASASGPFPSLFPLPSIAYMGAAARCSSPFYQKEESYAQHRTLLFGAVDGT